MTATTRRRRARVIGTLVTVTLLLAVLGCGAGGSPEEPGAKPIFNGLLLPLVPESEKFIRFQPVDQSAPIAHVTIPQHPFMAPNVGNNMHSEAYMSDSYEASGPLGLNPRVSSRSQGFGCLFKEIIISD